MNAPIKALIIDDEEHAQIALKALLDLYCPQVQVIACASKLTVGKNLIETLNPNLVFLDIMVGEEFGFDLLDDFDQLDFQIIFTSGHSEFATRAFRVNALDYLLKPIEPSELKAAVGRVKIQLPRQKLKQQISSLAKSLYQQKIDQLAIHSTGGMNFIDFNDIIHIKGSGSYSTFFLKEHKQVIASKNLGYYYNILPKEIFYRCHQSHLVNLQYVSKILKTDGDQIELKEGTTIPLASKRKDGLISMLSRRYIS